MKIDDAKKIAEEILVNSGLNTDGAKIVADCFVTADACGVFTHGVSVLASHVKKIKSGHYNISSDITIEKQSHAFTLVNSNNIMGPISAHECMNIAIENAKEEGVHTVFAKNANTYGPAFYYTKMATDKGLVGITFCNTPAAMAPWGGYEKLIGTNPVAVGIPGDKRGPILFDAATSKVAKSKIGKAMKNGEPIPDDWALDVNGNPTTDPLEAIKGVVLPMAEYKGYGVALVIDILSGLISGAGYSTSVNKFYSDDGAPMNVGQTFVAMDPQYILGDEFYCKVDEYINSIHSSKSVNERPPIYPGENKNKNYENSLVNGIDYDSSTIEMLNCLVE